MSDYPYWEDAPIDATHWAAESEGFYEAWYKQDDSGCWSCVNVDSWRLFKSPWFGLGSSETPRYGEQPLIARGSE